MLFHLEEASTCRCVFDTDNVESGLLNANNQISTRFQMNVEHRLAKQVVILSCNLFLFSLPPSSLSAARGIIPDGATGNSKKQHSSASCICTM